MSKAVSLGKFRWSRYPTVGRLIRASEMATERSEELKTYEPYQTYPQTKVARQHSLFFPRNSMPGRLILRFKYK